MGNVISFVSILSMIAFLSPAAVLASVSSNISASKFQSLVGDGINPQALRVALQGYSWAQTRGDVHKHIMTLVDFTKPSTAKRLWVINLDSGSVMYNGLVAHGSGSGKLYATQFSNQGSSRESSLGAMVTGGTYSGKHGTEVRINGLESGVNSAVASRAVIFHSATYATPAFAKAHGYLGRSWGCFAINPADAHRVFSEIKDGSFVFAYAPQENYDTHFTS